MTDVAGDHYFKVEENLGGGYVRLKVAEAERRQAKHDIRSVEDVLVELLRNSRDAGATRIFVCLHKEEDKRRDIIVVDDGVGIPQNLRERIFESRVTSKVDTVMMDKYGVHGRGMALFSIRSAAEKAKVAWSAVGGGTAMRVNLDIENVPERKDQSTWPEIRVRSGEPMVVRGPRNCLRTLVEFNLDHPELDVRVGSPAEVVAALVCGSEGESEGRRRSSALSPTDIAGEGGPWVLERDIGDAGALGVFCRDWLGAPISRRTAQRIMAGQVNAATRVLEKALTAVPLAREVIGGPSTESLARRISDRDLQRLTQVVAEAVRNIGEQYFVEIAGSPIVTRDGSRIRICVGLKEDAR